MFWVTAMMAGFIGAWIYTTILLARQEKRNDALMRENEQMRSYNRYLVARYGIGQAAENPQAKSLRVEPIKKAKVIRQVVPLEQNYYDGVAYPGQYLDTELEWNKNTQK